MYIVKIEYQSVARWYKADSYTDAMELFYLLTKKCHSVQVWKGMETVAEYTN
jgi:hypothetical protein